MRIFNSKVGLPTVVCLVVVLSSSAIMMPWAANFWYKLAAGHSLSKDISAHGNSKGILYDLWLETIKSDAQRAGRVYASLMILGVHLPATALLLIGVGLLSMSTTRECKLLLQKVFWVVCAIGILFFSLAIPYSGQANLFPRSIPPALLIYGMASAVLWSVVGVVVLIRKGWAKYIEPELMRQPNEIEKQKSGVFAEITKTGETPASDLQGQASHK